jgi:hypothetical protein
MANPSSLFPPLSRPFRFKELNQLTGIAALLTFPLDIEDVLEEERMEAEEKEKSHRLQDEE